MNRLPAAFLALLAIWSLPTAAQEPPRPAPEAATGVAQKQVVQARRMMVVSADPAATEAGMAVLNAGGSAVDAAVTVQLVLNLVEPQSSGIGGGAFMLHWDGTERQAHHPRRSRDRTRRRRPRLLPEARRHARGFRGGGPGRPLGRRARHAGAPRPRPRAARPPPLARASGPGHPARRGGLPGLLAPRRPDRRRCRDAPALPRPPPPTSSNPTARPRPPVPVSATRPLPPPCAGSPRKVCAPSTRARSAASSSAPCARRRPTPA